MMEQTPATKPNWTAIHPKVGASMFAGACVSFILGIMRMKFGIDLSGQEANLMIIVSGLAGYFMPGDAS